MRKNRNRLAAIGLSALALGVIVGPGTAQAAKVSEKEGPVVVPDASQANADAPVIAGENSITFNLGGKKVTKKQILDVDLTLNATGSAAGALGDLGITLTKSKIGSAGVPAPGGTVWSDLEFSDQSDLFACNPLVEIASGCNYLQGGTTFTGQLNASFNPVFKGGNPKGRWTLSFEDFDPSGGSSSTVSAELEVKTGAKFAKE